LGLLNFLFSGLGLRNGDIMEVGVELAMNWKVRPTLPHIVLFILYILAKKDWVKAMLSTFG